METKKRILSGIQPTGSFTLGNYIGAVRQWQAMQEEYECLYMIANLHALTVRQVPAELRRRTREAAALLLACGIDPAKSTLFIQSEVPCHAELAWVLACNAQFGELSRMTQFKDKSQKHPENINAGLFTYPVLMASDILVYNADLVPIGIDQKQHLELARNIAGRFNAAYSDTFTVPEAYYPKQGAKVMSLADPEKKMSKSDTNENGYVLLLDTPDTILRKLKRSVTDSEARVYYSEEKKGVSNLMSIYSVLSGKDYMAIEQEFENRGYGDFKQAVAESIIDTLAPIRSEYERILQDKAYLDEVLKQGSEKAYSLAKRTLGKVYKKSGLL